MDIPSSSRHGSDEYSRKHAKDDSRRHKKHKKRRSRSRSRSSTPPKKRSSMIYVNPAITRGLSSSMVMAEKTKSEYEVRIQALNLQLQLSNERATSIEQDLRSAKYGQQQAEQRLTIELAEKQNLQTRNHEILAIMNTLQLGCEALQRDKMDMEIRIEKMNEEKEKFNKEKKELKEQNDFMTQRNLTLVKKCETVCEENKTLKSKLEEAERELENTRPNMEKMESELSMKRVEFSKLAEKVIELERKEMRFESEKRELERKLETKEATLMAERRNNEEWRKNQIAIRVDLQRKVDNLKPEIDRLEHMKTLEKLVDSIQRHYELELVKLRKQLLLVENATRSTVIHIEQSKAGLHNQRAGSAPPSSNWSKLEATNITEELLRDPLDDDLLKDGLTDEVLMEHEIETILNGES
uniref:Uncharacterized protein n=1 Tax=Acrobeloides nanus TaxID=290746 RepID=A0A914E871_9BILA